MGRLARTDNLSDVQEEILSTVRQFVDKEILRTPPSPSIATSTSPTSSKA